MAIDLGRWLISAGLVAPEEIEAALFVSVVRGVPFVRALLDRGAVSARLLEEELERREIPALRQVVALPELVASLPQGLCARLGAVPTRLDPFTGTVDVAAADPLDPHVGVEFGHHLGRPIRILCASLGAIEEAIRRAKDHQEAKGHQEEEGALRRRRRATPPFPHGAPSSTVPPPESDAFGAPIPLVRRSGTLPGPPPPAIDPSLIDEEGEPVLPLFHTKPHGPARPGGAPALRDAGEGGAAADEDLGRELEHAPGRGAGSAPVPAEGPAQPPAPPPSEGPRTPRLGSGDYSGFAAGLSPTLPAFPPAPRPISPEPGPRPARAKAPLLPPAATRDPTPSQRLPRPPALPYSDLSAVFHALGEVGSRDEVFRLALRGLRLLARRVALFSVRRDHFAGLHCNVAFGDPDVFRALEISQSAPSILATATVTPVYLGPIPNTPAHAGLLDLLGGSSQDVAVVAARVAGKPAMLLVADDLDDAMVGTRRMMALGEAVGRALARVLALRPSRT